MGNCEAIRIVNVVAYMRFEKPIDFYKTAKLNKHLDYDEISCYAFLPTSTGKGKISVSRHGMEIFGAQSEKQACEEINKAMSKLRIVYVEGTMPKEKEKILIKAGFKKE